MQSISRLPPPLGCLMGNHFHLLFRVPERPAGFDVALLILTPLSRHSAR
jgi:REP element-mobilizing transposase RayT